MFKEPSSHQDALRKKVVHNLMPINAEIDQIGANFGEVETKSLGALNLSCCN